MVGLACMALNIQVYDHLMTLGCIKG